jgi:hypothetical protein
MAQTANIAAKGEFIPSSKTLKDNNADTASRKGQNGHDIKDSLAKRAAKGLWGRFHKSDN